MSFTTRMFPRARAMLALLPLTFASTAVLAQQSPALDRFNLWIGGFDASTNTTIGASDKSGQYKGSVNLEDDLGLDDHKTVPRAHMDVLIGDSQGFSFDYFSVNRSRGTTLGKSISYGGNDYSAAASVRGKLDFDLGSAAYRWWFGHGDDVVGLGLGAAYYRVNAGIYGDASFNGQTVGYASTSTDESAWAPMLEGGWRHAFNDQWRMYFDASGVKKNGGTLNGHIYRAALGLQWFPWRNVGVGAEYDYTRISLNDDRRHYDASLDMKMKGPALFVGFRF